MSCDDFNRELSHWLEAEWDAETPSGGKVPGSLSRHATGCEECGYRLRSALALINTRNSVIDPPPFLSARINENLSGAKPKERGHPVLYSSLAAAVAVVIIAVGLITGSFTFNRGGVSELLVTFALEAPGATRVYVVGDWNNWNAGANPLQDDNADGIWETAIKLEAGNEYRYQFYIDDNRWLPDPKAPLKIDDGFGGQNSILRI